MLIFINIINNKKINHKININFSEKLNITKDNLDSYKSEIINISDKTCYFFPHNSNLRIIHLIITKFLLEIYKLNGIPKKLYREDYISDGIRVLKKYLFPSLENQSCKNFTFI